MVEKYLSGCRLNVAYGVAYFVSALSYYRFTCIITFNKTKTVLKWDVHVPHIKLKKKRYSLTSVITSAPLENQRINPHIDYNYSSFEKLRYIRDNGFNNIGINNTKIFGVLCVVINEVDFSHIHYEKETCTYTYLWKSRLLSLCLLTWLICIRV